MKTVTVKDEKAVAKWTMEYLKKIQESPEKYMPMCTLCGIERSGILMVHEVEGMKQIALFGICKKCCPDGVVDEEMVKRIMESVKNRMKTGESAIHITPEIWEC